MTADCQACLVGVPQIRTPVGKPDDPIGACLNCGSLTCGEHGHRDPKPAFLCIECDSNLQAGSAGWVAWQLQQSGQAAQPSGGGSSAGVSGAGGASPSAARAAAALQELLPAGARIGELAERAKLTNQSVGYLVDYLEEHGYVERRPDPTNRRATLVCFTERGWDEADACAKILDQLDEELTKRMGAERLEQLQALLAEATAALQASKLAIQAPPASVRPAAIRLVSLQPQ